VTGLSPVKLLKFNPGEIKTNMESATDGNKVFTNTISV